MRDLGIISNNHILAKEAGNWAQIVPKQINQAVRQVALTFKEDCEAEIRTMIYNQPPSPTYVRTQGLYKGHRHKSLQEGTYIVFHTSPYAIYVHDGFTHALTGKHHAPRPWMDTVMKNNQDKYQEIMDSAVHFP